MRERLRLRPREAGDESSPDRGLRQYHRMFLVAVLAIFILSVVSLNTSNEAKATHYDGWYSDQCYWTHDDYYDVWSMWGCYVYYQGIYYYQDYQNDWYVYSGGGWVPYDVWVLARTQDNPVLRAAIAANNVEFIRNMPGW